MNNSDTIGKCHLSQCDNSLDTTIFLVSVVCLVLWFILTLRWLVKNRDLLAMMSDPRAFMEARRCKLREEPIYTVEFNANVSDLEIDIDLENDDPVLKIMK